MPWQADLENSLHPHQRCFSACCRLSPKVYAMDFYITKYQGKMMESLTPLLQTMTTGIQRLAQQEKEEAEKAQVAPVDFHGATNHIYECV